ncbi:hypothetical protein QYE76_060916 [Lolium multiflorum]|uniref:Transposase (putative) gypsy type domain-containing protein n=1 Tax=Lolium multiflorum TaxID=4521 RepID=A0AAD8W485_LOLMU|nr:hypothetical protein QYE76_060916 [Lolium multiflorum]
MAAEDLEWERSKISNQDVNMLKRLGLMKKEDAIRFPSEESYPNPPMEYRVSFVDHLIRGLSTPIHDFLRGLLFVYGIQLHQLTPNSILHISIFITLCECFLGIPPNWALWKRIFCLRRNGAHNATYNMALLSVSELTLITSTSNFLILSKDGAKECSLFRLKNPLWTYAGENDANRLSNDLSVKDLEKLIRRISSLSKRDPIPSSCRVEPYSSANPLPKPMIKELIRIGAQFIGYREYANKTEEKLAAINERANALAQKLEQSEEASKKAELDAVQARAEADKAKTEAASVEDLRKRLHTAETSLSEHITAQSAREEAILKRIRTQSRRFLNRTAQEFELEDPDNDPLLDALSFLEFHGSEAREGIDHAKAGLSRLFPYFFPKKEEPATFLNLAKCFNPPEDLGLKVRHENMKVAVENTVALVADSQQTVDWAKVGDTEQIEQSRWKLLIKAAKPNTKKILGYLGIKPSSTPSSSRPEV